MKILKIIPVLVVIYSCKPNSSNIEHQLQKNLWHVAGRLGDESMMLSVTNVKSDWQASFLPSGKLSELIELQTTEPVFDAHGNEVLPGSPYIDSCYTYEIKNDVVMILSHGHPAPEVPEYYKISSTSDGVGYKFTAVAQTEFK